MECNQSKLDAQKDRSYHNLATIDQVSWASTCLIWYYPLVLANKLWWALVLKYHWCFVFVLIRLKFVVARVLFVLFDLLGGK